MRALKRGEVIQLQRYCLYNSTHPVKRPRVAAGKGVRPKKRERACSVPHLRSISRRCSAEEGSPLSYLFVIASTRAKKSRWPFVSTVEP